MAKQRQISPLGIKIKSLMQLKGISTYIDLERSAGIENEAVRRVCGGIVQSVSFATLEKIAMALGVSVAELTSTHDVSASSLNIAPNAINARWTNMQSDEMATTITPGHFMLIDYGVNEINSAGIYLIQPTGSGTSVLRRVELNAVNGGKVFLSCDNPKYRSEGDCDAKKLNIQGKVLGFYTPL